MSYLINTGRWSGRIRKHLRAFLASKDNQNAYINELIDKDYQKSLEAIKMIEVSREELEVLYPLKPNKKESHDPS